MQGQKARYYNIFRNVPTGIYTEVSAFLWNKFKEKAVHDGEGRTSYVLNKNMAQIIRINRKKRRIEISDKVDSEIAESIKNMINTETANAGSAR